MTRTPRLEDRRERLIQAAARLFNDHGYERSSVRQLAESVGILSGSVFHHFASKEDILLAVMTTTIETMTERLRAVTAASRDIPERLTGLIRAELELLHGNTRHGVAVTFFQWHCLGQDNQQQVLAMREEYEKVWLDALGQAHQAGLIHTDPFITRRLLTGANGWTIYWYRPGGALDLDALAQEVTTLLTGPRNQDL
ncbi:MAG: TetR/AcrR family transcriptional regulator [Wenzhouxiangellaceae bacterium]|nr:TetR/AcrR family transcriptional regulator [Wenzhouxiangellaceae bacterium]